MEEILMMSWLVKTLIKNRYKIRSDIFIRQEKEGLVEVNLDDDTYNDLLILEKKIVDMHSKGYLTDAEVALLDMLSEDMSYREMKSALGISINSIKKMLDEVCNKIAFSLGGEFTDYGTVEFMVNKYKLTDDQTEKLIKFIENAKGKNI